MLKIKAKYLQVIAATFGAGIFFAGIALSKSVDSKDAKIVKSTAPVNDSAFHKDLLAIAAGYEQYGKVDDYARWSPALCIMPPPPRARLSTSKDSSTHGKKVYFLFAKNRNEYFNNETSKVGQVVVKESWYPSADGTAQAAAQPIASDKKMGLFIMMKLAPKTPGTDNGWVYGTVTADGKTVTSAGRVQSCMECHSPAPYDRLFGLAK